jgi:hypothetical protein
MRLEWSWKRHVLVIGIIVALFATTTIIMSRTTSRDISPSPSSPTTRLTATLELIPAAGFPDGHDMKFTNTGNVDWHGFRIVVRWNDVDWSADYSNYIIKPHFTQYVQFSDLKDSHGSSMSGNDAISKTPGQVPLMTVTVRTSPEGEWQEVEVYGE